MGNLCSVVSVRGKLFVLNYIKYLVLYSTEEIPPLIEILRIDGVEVYGTVVLVICDLRRIKYLSKKPHYNN